MLKRMIIFIGALFLILGGSGAMLLSVLECLIKNYHNSLFLCFLGFFVAMSGSTLIENTIKG